MDKLGWRVKLRKLRTDKKNAPRTTEDEWLEAFQTFRRHWWLTITKACTQKDEDEARAWQYRYACVMYHAGWEDELLAAMLAIWDAGLCMTADMVEAHVKSMHAENDHLM